MKKIIYVLKYLYPITITNNCFYKNLPNKNT